ncbi:MAG: SDR family NAD(P)-dependent oxidoreductase [Deltaproteobacteria bacterium]|nr:SDR family NAD(P)-dependent oxidoreductase [Deltaproteobacteria bacterium]
MKDRRPDLVSTPPAAPVAAAAAVASPPVGSASLAPGVPAAVAAADPVAEQVLTLFAEKTGYPRDMLDPELDLEADLGIDTVKQAELFATVRETFAIPRDEKLKLRDFPTLGHVVGFVKDRRPELVSTPPAAAVAAADPVAEQVLTLFAEKTGYPRDMLDLDLDLEADLGIDTVKQAELFATVRETFAIPREETLKLRDFPTLGHVIGFVKDRRPDLVSTQPSAPPPPATPGPSEAPAAAGAAGAFLCDLDAANAIPRRVPVAVLRPALALTKPTHVVLGDEQRVVVMPDASGVAKALVRQLKKRGVRVLQLDPASTTVGLERTLDEALAAGPIGGVYWLPALDPEGDLASFDLAAWRAALALRVKLLYTTIRKLYEVLASPGTFLVAATRLGGHHGYDEIGALHPLGGAVTGFTKTVKRERPAALVKAVDFEDAARPSEVAQRLVDETLFDPGIVEVGWCDDLRFGVALEERPATNGANGLELNRESVFLVTGAAGGITSAIVADLAAASGGTFHLLDLVAAPDPSNPDLTRFTSDKEGLKRDLFERIKARGERATPALVEKELAGIERALAALAAIRAVESAGGRAHYHRVDLRDAAMVEAAVAEAKRTSGRIDVLLHAGGLEVSRFLPDKSPTEFDLIFDVKSDGWFNLMKALGDTPIGATVAFSSVAGRFGNGGQADYAAANDLLCKLTSNLRIHRPETRAIVIDWTAWSGIGMASRGSIPKMMEAAGIDMLPALAGIPIIRRELTGGATRGELVIGQRLGVLVEEWDEQGGLDVAKIVTRDAGPMVGSVVGMRLHEGLAADVTLDPRAQPFLHDHQIDGTPVLPGVMGIEGFVELARLVLPGWHVAAVEDVRFLAPIKFYRHEPRTLRLVAQFRRDGNELLADARLVASRAVMGQVGAQPTTHFAARLRLSKSAPRASRVSEPPGPDAERASVTASDVYRVYFHGPAYRVLEQVWRGGNGAVARLATDLPANHEPPSQPLFAAPRLVELCFQTAGVWQLGTQGRMALPHAIESLTVYPSAAEPTGEVRAATLARAGGIDAYVIDGAGRTLVTLRGYRTIELPDPVDEESLAPLRAAMA